MYLKQKTVQKKYLKSHIKISKCESATVPFLRFCIFTLDMDFVSSIFQIFLNYLLYNRLTLPHMNLVVLATTFVREHIAPGAIFSPEQPRQWNGVEIKSNLFSLDLLYNYSCLIFNPFSEMPRNGRTVWVWWILLRWARIRILWPKIEYLLVQ